MQATKNQNKMRLIFLFFLVFFIITVAVSGREIIYIIGVYIGTDSMQSYYYYNFTIPGNRTIEIIANTQGGMIELWNLKQ